MGITTAHGSGDYYSFLYHMLSSKVRDKSQKSQLGKVHSVYKFSFRIFYKYYSQNHPKDLFLIAVTTIADFSNFIYIYAIEL